ncbi:MAG: hypothetical protein Q7U82_08055 [Gammaproteobacteria bacterium]|nr:hypothetical protein [Gammaproteobacteria bacterium]
MIKTTLFALAAATLILHNTTYAADKLSRTHTVDVTDIEEIVIEGGVGSMEVVPADGSELIVELEIEAERNWYGRSRDIDDIDIVVNKRGDRLIVEVNEKDLDNVELHWHIEMPEVHRTTVNLGVGQIIAEVQNTELRVDLGVGEARITAASEHMGRVEASSGVGRASISGGNNTINKRSFVSENVQGYGEGTNDVDVQVGVGEATVALRGH